MPVSGWQHPSGMHEALQAALAEPSKFAAQALALKDAYEAEDDVDDAAEDAAEEQHEREALAALVQPIKAQPPAAGAAGCDA